MSFSDFMHGVLGFLGATKDYPGLGPFWGAIFGSMLSAGVVGGVVHARTKRHQEAVALFEFDKRFHDLADFAHRLSLQYRGAQGDQAEVARAEGALAEAASRYDNLLTGKRPEEQDVVRGQRREAEASLTLAETELQRQTLLLEKGFTTRQNYDQANSMMRQLRSHVASLTAQEKVGDLAARPDEISAAKASVDQNEANLEQARKRLDDLMPAAPEDGLIENTFFNVGEWVPAGTPVVSLLPPTRVKLRFFVPEEDIVRAKTGDVVSFTCDSCPADLKARIIYVSPRSEFTPPVIYSQSARTKLVFLIEARPEETRTLLPPGLPVAVAPLAR